MSHCHFLIFCFHAWSVVISLLGVLKVVILVTANAVKKFSPIYDFVRKALTHVSSFKTNTMSAKCNEAFSL